MKKRILFGVVLLFSLLTLPSCLEDDNTFEELQVWKARNEAFFQNMVDTTHVVDGDTVPVYSKIFSGAYPYQFLLYRVIEESDLDDPTIPLFTSTVKVDYIGYTIDQFVPLKPGEKVDYVGKEGDHFDSSNGKGVEFLVTGVIPGWTWALQNMPEGATWELVIPYTMAYGAGGQGSILPYSTLSFRVKLLDVVKDETGTNPEPEVQ